MKSYEKKLMMPAILAAAVCFACTGCGKMTEEKLMENMGKAMEGRTFFGGDMDLVLGMTYSVDMMEIPMAIDMNMDMGGRILCSYEPLGLYYDVSTQTDIQADIGGETHNESVSDQAQIYTAQEDDNFAIYSHSGTSGQWSKTDIDSSVIDSLFRLITEAAETSESEESTEGITLDEESASLNGRDVYVLHVDSSSQADSEAFLTAMESILPQFGSSFSTESLDSIKGSTVMYIDQETFLPVQMECTIEGMDEFFSQNSDWMEELLGLAVEDAQIDNLSIHVPDYQLTISNLTFEQEELPVVPEEAYEAIAFQEALAELDPDLGDGTYAIQSTGNAVRIAPPENMTVSEIAAETVTFMDDAGLDTITYAMIPAANLSVYTDSISSMYTSILEMLGVEVQSGQDSQNVSTPFGPVDGYWLSGGGTNIYYGFAPFEGAYLAVIRSDFSGTEPDSAAALGEAFGYAAELTPADIL